MLRTYLFFLFKNFYYLYHVVYRCLMNQYIIIYIWIKQSNNESLLFPITLEKYITWKVLVTGFENDFVLLCQSQTSFLMATTFELKQRQYFTMSVVYSRRGCQMSVETAVKTCPAAASVYCIAVVELANHATYPILKPSPRKSRRVMTCRGPA